MSATTKRWLLDTGERAGRTFLQAYFAVWLALGAGYETLFTLENLKGGVVGVALSVAMSVGAKKTGADDSASLLPANVDPPQDPPKKAARKKAAPVKKAAKKRAGG